MVLYGSYNPEIIICPRPLQDFLSERSTNFFVALTSASLSHPAVPGWEVHRTSHGGVNRTTISIYIYVYIYIYVCIYIYMVDLYNGGFIYGYI